MNMSVKTNHTACCICEHWKALYKDKIKGKCPKVPHMVPYNGPICIHYSPAEEQNEPEAILKPINNNKKE
jgi:hypothetical protein